MAIIDNDFEDVSPKSAAINTGLLLGLTGVVFTIIYNMFDLIDYTGQKGNFLVNLPMYIVSWGIMYFGLVKYRDNDLGGHLNLGKAIGMGTLAGVVAGIIAMIFMYIYLSYIEPGLFGPILEQMADNFEEQGMESEQIDMAMKWSKLFMSPGAMAGMSLIMNVFFGFLMSLVIGFFVKTE